MKSVMLSVQPYWTYLIIAKAMWGASESKTIELRKNFPKTEEWNKKVILYCSKNKQSFKKIPKQYQPLMEKFLGKVIGEFVCDEIKQIMYDVPCSMSAFEMGFGYFQEPRFNIYLNDTCLSEDELFEYLGEADDISNESHPYPTYKFENGYAWHISDLKIYGKPKELSEFYSLPSKCRSSCKEENPMQFCGDCKQIKANRKIIKPPQSWCYCEEA